MTKIMIIKSVYFSFFMLLLFLASGSIVYLGAKYQLMPLLVCKVIAVISLIALTVSSALFIFGFLTPVLGGYIYENMLTKEAQSSILKIRIWRWLLNKDGQGSGRDGE